jgi:hypothetical protein
MLSHTVSPAPKNRQPPRIHWPAEVSGFTERKPSALLLSHFLRSGNSRAKHTARLIARTAPRMLSRITGACMVPGRVAPSTP